MQTLKPIYTEKTECQDCYKCVRHCPVKSIKVENNIASLMFDSCIYCGKCVEICPPKAKTVRQDIKRIKSLIKHKKKVIVSLAPSWPIAFKGWSEEQIIISLRKLGFKKVSETALGAQEVSTHLANELEVKKKGILISSACPVVVRYINLYKPELKKYLSQTMSPVMAHASMIKKNYSPNSAIVFIGPCIAKKVESDDNENILKISITFNELERWLHDEDIDKKKLSKSSNAKMFPKKAEEGIIYPLDGGMNKATDILCKNKDVDYLSFSGINQVKYALDGLEKVEKEHNNLIFLELLACEGGCINGPGMSKSSNIVERHLDIIKLSKPKLFPKDRISKIDIAHPWESKSIQKYTFEEKEIIEVLKKTGKKSKEDERNCGGCGYNNCREFAVAILEGKAETAMCVTYMREVAHKKANKLIATMPSGIIIVDDELRVIECNNKFCKILGNSTEVIFENRPGLSGAYLEKLIPFSNLFKQVLVGGQDILQKKIRTEDKILQCSIFTIEKNSVIGGIVQDITSPSMQKEQIIDKTRKVINKNLTTVQRIAYLLGENASETEMMLHSIIESFSAEKIDDK